MRLGRLVAARLLGFLNRSSSWSGRCSWPAMSVPSWRPRLLCTASRSCSICSVVRFTRALTRRADLVGCTRSPLPHEASQCPDSVPKTCLQNARLGAWAPRVRLSTGSEPVDAPSTNPDPLLAREVLCSVHLGNKKAAFCSGFVVPEEPSDGLEPSTPSLTMEVQGRSRRPPAGTRDCGFPAKCPPAAATRGS